MTATRNMRQPVDLSNVSGWGLMYTQYLLLCNYMFIIFFHIDLGCVPFLNKHVYSYIINRLMCGSVAPDILWREKVEACIFLNRQVHNIVPGTWTHLTEGRCVLASLAPTIANIYCPFSPLLGLPGWDSPSFTITFSWVLNYKSASQRQQKQSFKVGESQPSCC
jgi:hypothetical protein